MAFLPRGLQMRPGNAVTTRFIDVILTQVQKPGM